MAMVYVPDPAAPHCQPTPPADERPPMTDEALFDWLEKTYGLRTQIGPRYAFGPPGKPVAYFSVDADPAYSWDVWIASAHEPHRGYSLPAHIAGPALWAAHKYGAP
jgi:hypothetical protein